MKKMKVITMVQNKNLCWNKKGSYLSLRKNGGHMLSGLGGRSFPVDRQAGRLMKSRCLINILNHVT